MKTPLTAEEQRIIKLFSEINPVFDELAKATWPEVFEAKGLSLVAGMAPYVEVINMTHIRLSAELAKTPPPYFGGSHPQLENIVINDLPSPFPIDYEDEYDV